MFSNVKLTVTLGIKPGYTVRPHGCDNASLHEHWACTLGQKPQFGDTASRLAYRNTIVVLIFSMISNDIMSLARSFKYLKRRLYVAIRYLIV